MREHHFECLAFRLKWNCEIKKIQESDEEDLEDLEDPRNTRKWVDAVDLRANEEAMEFLIECGGQIRAHFTQMNKKIEKSKPLERDREIRKHWSLSYGIWPNDRNKPRDWKMRAGVDLRALEGNQFYIIPWIWHFDGEQGEAHLRYHLREDLSGIPDSDLRDGRVPLAMIPISISGSPTPLLNCDSILEEVTMAVQKITKEKFSHLYPK